ncbi:hypothetical protein ACU40M_10740 [Staphylococcus arlettae]
MDGYDITMAIITVLAFGFTIYTLLKEANKEKVRRKRTKEILETNIKDSINYLKKYYDIFEHNYDMYKETKENHPSQEFNHRIDIITYFINSYSNDLFLENLKKINQNIESYYINNIEDSKFDYDMYFELKTDLNELIKKLKYYKYQIDIFIEPYDEYLKYNLNEKIIYKNHTISNDLVTNDFNYTGNDSIINPVMYYNRIIREYDRYFNDLENLGVPLMASNDDQTAVRSFIDIDFASVHEEVNNIINKTTQNIDWE